MPQELPALPYAYDALEPYIDEETMHLHHDKHHATYVNNLNAALEKHPELAGKSAEELIRDLSSVPEDIKMVVRNNGGGHVNHSMFWQIMGPHGGQPSGALAQAIQESFGGLDALKQQFNDAGTKRFGSGWVWVVRDGSGKLSITSTANQDNPMMEDSYPVFGNDVWEHAYYLKYKNVRAEYLAAWWNVLNWQEIGRRFDQGSR